MKKLAALAAVVALHACSPEEQTPAPIASFNVAVIVDARSAQTPRADIERVVARASAKLAELRSVGLRITDVRYGLARTTDTDVGVRNLATTYLEEVVAAPPDAIIILTDDTRAASSGGYSIQLAPKYPLRNRFPSPMPGVGGDRVYLMMVHFDHIFARCGYNDLREHVSDVSIGGECRNRPGTPCIKNGDRWVCDDESRNDPYADHDTFTACTIVHELAHSFGTSMLVTDHFGTPECVERLGAAGTDTPRGDHYCQMCPDVYSRIPQTPVR